MIFPIAILLFLACISTTFSFTGKLIEDTSEKELIIAKTVQYLKEKKVNTSEEKMKALANSVYKESQEYDIDYRLILAVVKVESNFNNEAISRRGARGLMQIRPSSAKGIARESGVEVKGAKCLHEPEKNIKIGVSYLSKLQGMFDNMVSALHAYNAGPSKVKKADPEFGAKTTAFTRKVMNEYQQIIEVLPDPEE
jgi:soluble lytic murein transglycosylase